MVTLYLKWLRGRFFPTGNTAVDLETKASSDEASTAASAAESEPLEKFDVFINHRGPDTKSTFAAHLNVALTNAGFIPFLDVNSIRHGSHAFKSIDEALRGACVHVAIFSKRYAESKYCLDELVDMLHSGKVILPVFYDVKPEHLRRIQDGPFAKAFKKHKKRKRHDKIPKWKEALQRASEIMGYEVEGDEAKLIRSIVVAVQNEMPMNLQPQKRRFGLEESLKDVLKILDTMKESVHILGLDGMGGIGKTTLASEIYNHFVSHRQFQYRCFLKDVRSSDPFELQRQLLRDLIQEDLQSNSMENYRHKFDAFSRQRVLLIIDDIDNEAQFANLIPDIQQLGPGSRIIITSRHRDVLHFSMRQATSKYIYEVKVLNHTYSQQLFNWNAFYSEIPSPGFADLAEKVAEACGGLPLALEVVGASLFDKKDPDDREIWMDAVKTLKENEDILGKLRVSYDCLPTEGDKAMFRNIACLLIGMPCQVAMMIWKSCHSCGQGYCFTSKAPDLVLRRLLDKSLVKLNSGRLSMHDSIRDMGRDVVMKASPKPEEWTHLWETATAEKVLCRNKGTDTSVRGIRLSVRNTDGTVISKASQFASMEELHLLVLDGYPVVPDDFSRWSQELRWLQWKLIPYNELPLQLNLPKLTVLDLTDSVNLTRLWQNDAPIQFPTLQMLVLTNCRALEELPQNIGQSIPRLKTLEMDKCSLIAALPDSTGQLKDLENLNLTSCETLGALPDTIVHLAKLKKILLDGCYELDRLPSSMGGLRMLKELYMKNTLVEDLPEDFGQLTCLTSLSMSRLRNVPESFGGLKSLAILIVSFEVLDRSGRLASSLGDLTALKTLHLRNYSNITALPRTFGDLKSLVKLEMVNASALVAIEVLPQSLQHLDLAQCSRLIKVPSFAEMSALVFLNLRNCQSLTHIYGLECLTALEDIDLTGVTSLSDCTLVVQSGRNRVLRNCCLSGSKVAVAYDNRWLEEEPALQLISYYDDSIGYFPNELARNFVSQEWAFEVLIGATISNKSECVAPILCFVAYDQGWPDYPRKKHHPYKCGMEVHIMREGQVVSATSLLSMKHIADNRKQVFLWTLRREHPVVQSLQLGDRICVYVQSRMTVLEGAICIVHAEDDHLTLALNSELLSRSNSEELATNLGQLVLADDFHSSWTSELENDGIDTELDSKFGDLLVSDEMDSVNEHAANPDLIYEILSQQGWLIAPADGHYPWTHSWKLPREGQGIISFEAQGKNSVHVAISEHCNDVSSKSRMYEIVIGRWGNTNSVIQRYKGKRAGKDCCSVAAGLTHPEGVNRLWVSIDDRTSLIQVGRGERGQDVIAIYKDMGFLSSVQYVSFTSLDTPVTYSNVVITGTEQIPPLLNTYRLSEKILQPVLNGKWAMAAKFYGEYPWAQYWVLPRAGRGILSFLAEDSCVDIHVAISSRPYTVTPMYEIVVGAYRKTVSILRKRAQGYPVCRAKTEHLITSLTNQFWVMIDDITGTIQVGRGEPCQDNVFLVYKDADFLSEAQYCTFTTWFTPVTYSNVEITPILDP